MENDRDCHNYAVLPADVILLIFDFCDHFYQFHPEHATTVPVTSFFSKRNGELIPMILHLMLNRESCSLDHENFQIVLSHVRFLVVADLPLQVLDDKNEEKDENHDENDENEGDDRAVSVEKSGCDDLELWNRFWDIVNRVCMNLVRIRFLTWISSASFARRLVSCVDEWNMVKKIDEIWISNDIGTRLSEQLIELIGQKLRRITLENYRDCSRIISLLRSMAHKLKHCTLMYCQLTCDDVKQIFMCGAHLKILVLEWCEFNGDELALETSVVQNTKVESLDFQSEINEHSSKLLCDVITKSSVKHLRFIAEQNVMSQHVIPQLQASSSLIQLQSLFIQSYSIPDVQSIDEWSWLRRLKLLKRLHVDAGVLGKNGVQSLISSSQHIPSVEVIADHLSEEEQVPLGDRTLINLETPFEM